MLLAMTLLTIKANLVAEGKIVSPNEGLLSISEIYRMSSEIAYKSWHRH